MTPLNSLHCTEAEEDVLEHRGKIMKHVINFNTVMLCWVASLSLAQGQCPHAFLNMGVSAPIAPVVPLRM